MVDSPTLSLPDPAALVELFREPQQRVRVLDELHALGPSALRAVRAGLRHADWHVRHWCAIYLDHHSNPETLHDLIPLLHDPESRVRLWAIHSISCERCKDHECPIDIVPLLAERVANDSSARVKKMAVAMLATRPLDARIVPVLQSVLEKEVNAKLRLHAELGLRKYRAAGWI